MATNVPMSEKAASWLRDVLAGRAEPVAPREAATVMLLRAGAETGRGLQVYMLRRVRSMAFAPGAYVFPGGSVDTRDADHEVAWAGPAPEEWARQLKVGAPLARALVCAAVRETFEESGVLLAGPSEDEIVADTRGDDWEADRLALIDHSLSLAEFLERRALILRTDLLRPWSRWITPVVERRRYDTRFFVAILPEGQQTRDVGGEADRVAWLAPGEAVEGWERGELAMLPPTVSSLKDLADWDSIPALMSAHRDIVAVEPELREIEGELRLVVPDGVDYPF